MIETLKTFGIYIAGQVLAILLVLFILDFIKKKKAGGCGCGCGGSCGTKNTQPAPASTDFQYSQYLDL